MSARIYQPPKSATQSGQANAGGWILEFIADSPYTVDCLMGWTSESDTKGSQVKLKFKDMESAVKYAKSKGMNYEVIVRHENMAPRIKSYSSNFKYKK